MFGSDDSVHCCRVVFDISFVGAQNVFTFEELPEFQHTPVLIIHQTQSKATNSTLMT